jgi:F-type H+-transporting ATPase subunit alpha
MSMEHQVAVIWVATNGYLDGIAVSAIRQYEIEFLQFLKSKYTTVVTGLRDRKELTEEIVSGLKKAAEEFKGLFSAK